MIKAGANVSNLIDIVGVTIQNLRRPLVVFIPASTHKIKKYTSKSSEKLFSNNIKSSYIVVVSLID